MKIMWRLGALLLFMIWSADSSALALTAEWNRNAEEDMKEYQVYMCFTKQCVLQQIQANKVGVVPQSADGVKPTYSIPNGIEGSMAVSAQDQSGNESGLSNIIFFETLPPTNPTGLVIH